jgi:iron complex transport system ATP-binding protein
MLRCTGLTLSVPGRVLCTGLDAGFEPGEVWAVLGRNGTGKSTLIHALSGLSRPAGGRIELDGEPLLRLDGRARARRIGVLLQVEEGTYWGSVLEYVLLGRFPHARRWAGYSAGDVEEAESALDAVGMRAFAARRYATLSGGERQRVRIAQILAQRPGIFLLDEPLRERGETVVMVLHEPLWIGRACTHALLFSGEGGVDAGPADVLLTRDRLEHAYGCRLREVAHGEGRCFVPDV